jgi:hypothetical protein
MFTSYRSFIPVLPCTSHLAIPLCYIWPLRTWAPSGNVPQWYTHSVTPPQLVKDDHWFFLTGAYEWNPRLELYITPCQVTAQHKICWNCAGECATSFTLLSFWHPVKNWLEALFCIIIHYYITLAVLLCFHPNLICKHQLWLIKGDPCISFCYSASSDWKEFLYLPYFAYIVLPTGMIVIYSVSI